MFRQIATCVILAIAAPAFAEDKPNANALTPKEIAEGWVLLFDGETTFGWQPGDDVKVKDGVLTIGGGDRVALAALSTAFPFTFELEAEWRQMGGGQFSWLRERANDFERELPKEWTTISILAERSSEGLRQITERKLTPNGFKPTGGFAGTDNREPFQLSLKAPKGAIIEIRSLKFRPRQANPLFTGKSLNGWKVNAADPKRMLSKFEVTKDGELSVKNGPGDLVTEKEFDNFVLQFECKTLGKALNSGIFFRCIPGQYQNGYEAQIQNAYLNDDRTKPADYGTGAIYRRIAARKVVSNDDEWFTMTVVANGKHMATWVNGYQTVDWTDDRKENDNPRQGYRAAKGPLSIQGHDKTTDLLFKNIRIAELLGENK
jgi:hypothetical protein